MVGPGFESAYLGLIILHKKGSLPLPNCPVYESVRELLARRRLGEDINHICFPPNSHLVTTFMDNLGALS
jgi:hypothetical protein